MDRLIRDGFVPVIPPVLVRGEAMFGTGFFPTDQAQVYRCADDDLYLAGTAEVLPALWARVQSGEVPAWKARRVAERTRGLPLVSVVRVDEQIAAFAGALPMSRLDRVVRGALIDAEPDDTRTAGERAADGRGVWVSRLLNRATPAPPGPDAGSGPLAASSAAGAAGAPGNALPGIAALAAALATGSCEISAHGGRSVPAPAG